MDDDKQTIRSWFGLAEPFDWRKRSYLGPFLFVFGVLIVGGLFSLAIAAAFKLLGSAVFGVLPQGSGSSFGLTGIIVAMIGAPFVVWRAVVAQKQVNVAEQGQITDRISKAVEGLGAEKTLKKDSEESTAPNLEVRIGAIYALERIAQDSMRDHIQIMEILCAYIRENAPLRETPENPFEVWEASEADNSENGEMPEWITMETWVRTLQKPRTDIQVALEVIGRRNSRQIKIERNATVRGSEVGYRLDLRSTCLQRADLSELDFINVLFDAAHLQGAILRGVQLQGASLDEAKLQMAELTEALLQGADLHGAKLHLAQLGEALLLGASLLGAQMQGALLLRTQMQGTKLHHVKFQGASLFDAKLQGVLLSNVEFDPSTSLSTAIFRGAALNDIDLTTATIRSDQIAEMFGDATVTLPGGHGPEHESWPTHWSKENLEWDDFELQWRAFQRSIGQDPDNPA